jgi:hypothetical protein
VLRLRWRRQWRVWNWWRWRSIASGFALSVLSVLLWRQVNDFNNFVVHRRFSFFGRFFGNSISLFLIRRVSNVFICDFGGLLGSIFILLFILRFFFFKRVSFRYLLSLSLGFCYSGSLLRSKFFRPLCCVLLEEVESICILPA